MDVRIALAPGTVLRFDSSGCVTVYTIRRQIARGGSCIVYDASYADNLGNFKLVRVKECYPRDLAISRSADGSLRADARDEEAFIAAQARMKDAYRRNHELFCVDELTNSVANTSNIYEANGTVYIVSTYLNGETLAKREFQSLRECISLIKSAAIALGRIHDAGYLYLDMKPDNVFTIRGSEASQLFDFDSMISISALENALASDDANAIRVSFTKGFAPLEQQTGRLSQLGRHSDVFSVGAVLFDALWGRPPTAFDCDTNAVFDFSETIFSDKSYQDGLYRALTRFFHRTLASFTGDRYQDMASAIQQLDEILALSDETKPWLISTPLSAPAFFTGREVELSALSQLLERDDGRVFSLYGIGGIGKSTLVREYISRHREEFDAVLWLYADTSSEAILANDRLVHVNTHKMMKEESSEEYIERKLRVLMEIAARGRVFVVLDDVEPERLPELRTLLNVGWKALLISRKRLPEGLYPEYELGKMEADDVAALFARYSRAPIRTRQGRDDFAAISSATGAHTLTMELLARQIRQQFLSLREAAELISRAGFRALAPEQIDYVKDQRAMRATFADILDGLIEIDCFSDKDRILMKLLSIFDAQGIRAGLFLELTGASDFSTMNRLESAGWLNVSDQTLRLHPMIREYIRAWTWTDDAERARIEMMAQLYEMIRPSDAYGVRHDADKQFPCDYGDLLELLTLAEQLLREQTQVTPESQRLLYRLLMDSPVDREQDTLGRMLALLDCPAFLDSDCILRLYEVSAFYMGRLGRYSDALGQLKAMRRYLAEHPSDYYLSCYHRATAVILHNAGGSLAKCLYHQDRAIAAARGSGHFDAGKQLASALLDKATTLLDGGLSMGSCAKLIAEARGLVFEHTKPFDYERYQFFCISAMYFAMNGDETRARINLREATDIASSAPDSAMAYIDHLIDQAAPILIAMNDRDEAIAVIQEAIALCDEQPDAMPYQRKRRDALVLLAQINGENA